MSRTKRANALAKNQVNIALVYVYVGLLLGQTVLSFALPESLFASLVSTGSFVIYVIVVFALRTSLTELIDKGNSYPITLNPFLIFFFNIIYFQYKINEAIDKQS